MNTTETNRLVSAADRLLAQLDVRRADEAITRFEALQTDWALARLERILARVKESHRVRGTVTYRPPTTRRAQVFRPVSDPSLRTRKA